MSLAMTIFRLATPVRRPATGVRSVATAFRRLATPARAVATGFRQPATTFRHLRRQSDELRRVSGHLRRSSVKLRRDFEPQVNGRDSALRCPRRPAKRRCDGTAGQNVSLAPFVPSSTSLGRGRRSAAPLPSELRTLAICKINERPIFGTRDEFFSNGIFQNVIGFLPPTFVIPQTMFKKIALPDNADFFGRPFFPFADGALNRLARRWKRNQRVQMIRHEQEKIRPPQKFILPMTDGFKNACRDFRRGKLISISQFRVRTARRAVPVAQRSAGATEPLVNRVSHHHARSVLGFARTGTPQRGVPTIIKTLPAIDGDEINFLLRVNPQWNVVRQGFSFGNVHNLELTNTPHADKLKLPAPNSVGTARCAVRARKAGATSVVRPACRRTIPAALPPGTAQRAVSTNQNQRPEEIKLP